MSKLTKAQQEVFDWIKANKPGVWVHPDELPHWFKNPTHRCQILERIGVLESEFIRGVRRDGIHYRVKQ